jgi:ABC-type transporter Mla subunit MlaD
MNQNYLTDNAIKQLHEIADIAINRTQQSKQITNSARLSWVQALQRSRHLSSCIDEIEKVVNTTRNQTAVSHLKAALDALRDERAKITMAINDALHRMTCIRVELEEEPSESGPWTVDEEDSCRLEF